MDADVKKCCFCLTSLDDEVLYGKFYELNDIQTHYYCLLLSSNIQQHGKDDEGILGFLMEDIQKEISRGKRLKCSYCHKKGATLFCCKSKCKKIFHLPCGRLNNSLHHFYGEFKSYCFKHRPIQVITSPVLEDSSKSVNECAICFEVVKSWPNIDTLWAPCCSVNSWFHRNCIQKLALSAGYFFKCPLCNNKDYFQVSMLEQGIFIPEQDASWELVPNAFAELLERYEQCDADACLSPKGRKYTSCRTKWEIVLCRLCGSQGTHVQCGNLKTKRRAWECSNCTSMLQSARKDNSISETQPVTISDISEPDGMRSRLLSLNNSLTRGCASSERISSSGESDIESNIAGQGAARSTRKTIQSNINKSVSFDDDIQVTICVSGNSNGYITRSRIREARYSKSWAEKLQFYKQKFRLKEVKIVLRRCDEASLHLKEEENRVCMENEKENELATIPFSSCRQNINGDLVLQLWYKSFFETEDCVIIKHLMCSDFTTYNKLERNQSGERVHAKSINTVLTNSSARNIIMKMYSKCSQLITNQLSIYSLKLDIEWYGNDWNKTCALQIYKYYNYSFFHQVDDIFDCNNRRKRKLTRQTVSTHELLRCNNCATETSQCGICKTKTLKLWNSTNKFLLYPNQSDFSDYMGSDCCSEKKIKKLKTDHCFANFSNVNQQEIANFNISENSYDLKYFQHYKIGSRNSFSVDQGKTLVLSKKNIVPSDAMSTFKSLKLENYLSYKSGSPDVFCVSEKYDIHKEELTLTNIRYPKESKDQIISLNEVGISCHKSALSLVNSYKENSSVFFYKPFANKLWGEHNVAETRWKVKSLVKTPNKDNKSNNNLYQSKQMPLGANYSLEPSNITEQKRATVNSLFNLFKETGNCKSERSCRIGALNRENGENTLMLDQSMHHLKRNYTDFKHNSQKNNLFNNSCSGSLHSEKSSHTLKKNVVNELKRLGAISHHPKRTILKQINSENVLNEVFDSHTEKIYRGLGVKHSILK